MAVKEIPGALRETQIALIGPMGSGKSSVGQQLAHQLKRPFYDSDAEIEKSTGVDIGWIFEKEGEEGFRDRESRMLEQLLDLHEPMVLATGGGIVVRKSNRDLLMRNSWVVYLQANLDQQVRNTRRVARRPLLQDKDRRIELARLMEERDPLYLSVADCVIVPHKRKGATMHHILTVYQAA